MQGEELVLITYKVFEKGENKIIWNGCSNSGEVLKPGIYICSIKAGRDVKMIKIIKTK